LSKARELNKILKVDEISEDKQSDRRKKVIKEAAAAIYS